MNLKNNLISLLAISFLMGVGGGLFLEKKLCFNLKNFGLALVFILGLVFLLGKFSKNRAVWWGLILFLGFGLGFLRASWKLAELDSKKGGSIEGVGLVVRDPRMKETYQEVVLAILECRKGSFCQNDQSFSKDASLSTKTLVFLEKYQNLNKGDLVFFSGNLQIPENRNSVKFDYRKFLAKEGIFYLLKNQEIKKAKIEENEIGYWRKYLSILKNKLEEKIIQLYSPQEAAFLAGILLGGDDRMEESLRQKFIKTGMIHLVAVSGFNITILGVALVGLAILVGFYRKNAFWLALAGIWIFLALIDFPSSGVRAGIMGSLLLWAIRLGRLASSNQALLLAAFLMILLSPLALFYDIGFQLSFLAAWGIVNLYPPLAENFNVKNDFLELKSIVIASLSAQLGVLGILIFNFQAFSPISFLVNILILPLIPALMLVGFISIVLGFILMPLAQMIALGVGKIIQFQIAAVDFFSRFSFSQVEISGLGVGWLLVYYIFIFLLVQRLKRKNQVFLKKA